ncbi:DsbA family protein [Nakamurella silvestris]|nr:DsbA family protein [Nakamurella silvestris]
MSKKPQPKTKAGSSGARQVAAARKSSGNRTAWVIGAGALVVVIAVAVVGIVLANRETKAVSDGYGSSQAVATIDTNGVITLSSGSPAVTIDVFEDPICPYCGAFEQKFGQQIAQSIDQGKLAVRYHLMNFLDASSASKDYSTRASAALMCVAQKSGSTPGVYGKFHDLLFSSGTQPKEGSSSDHTNAELAQFATDSGAGAAADCITSGTNVDLVKSSFAQSQATLTSVIGGVSSPVVLKDNVAVNTQNADWLTNLLAG